MGAATDTLRTWERMAVPLLEGLRRIGVGTFAGGIAGILVGGIGGRVVMRISGALSDPALAGQATENGNVLGVITAAGTLALAVFTGLFTGILGGVAYTALRPWLAPFGRWRGLAFGLFGLGLVGFGVIDRNNIDFTRFGPAALNVVMFAAIFVLFGVLVAPIERSADELSRGRRRSALAALVTIGVWLALVPAALVLAVVSADAITSLRALQLGVIDDSSRPSQLLLLTIALAAVLRWRPGVGPVTYAVLALPFTYGAWLTATNAWVLIR